MTDETKEPVVTLSRIADGDVQFMHHAMAIVFYSDGREALRISKDGVTANPDVPTDEAARAIYKALEAQIKALK